MSITNGKPNINLRLLTEREKEIFELIKANPNLSIQEISNILSVSVAAVNGTLRSLKQKSYIKRSDSEDNDNWIVLIWTGIKCKFR